MLYSCACGFALTDRVVFKQTVPLHRSAAFLVVVLPRTLEITPFICIDMHQGCLLLTLWFSIFVTCSFGFRRKHNILAPSVGAQLFLLQLT